MNIKRLVFLLLCTAFAMTSASAAADGNAGSEWRISNLLFHALNITSDGSSFWICGTDEAIAVSPDSGVHWILKHHTPDGNTLLNIKFVNSKFGYAAGAGGALLITEDGGQNWTARSAGKNAILQISFSDAQHGLIRTRRSLLFTSDGGNQWSPIGGGTSSGILKSFRYPFSVVALDPEHFAVMLKQGSAQYEPSAFLITNDGGKSWLAIDVPNTTLYSFIRAKDKYWVVGTEVIEKDKPGGGHAVPVALFSSDGINWTHSAADLSACRPEMCVACTRQGCLSSNGMIASFYTGKVHYEAFPPNLKLTSKWAVTESTVCFVGSTLQCAGLRKVSQAVTGEEPQPVPVAVSPGPLSDTASQGPQCISCPLDRILVNPKFQGMFTVKLSLVIGENGTVKDVKVDGAPTPEIELRIKQQVQQWLFEPVVINRSPVDFKANVRIRMNALRSR